MVKGDPRVIRGWTMYDWANSVYSLTITTAVFPIFYLAITHTDGQDQVLQRYGFRRNRSIPTPSRPASYWWRSSHHCSVGSPIIPVASSSS